MLTVEGVDVYRGKTHVLHQVDLAVHHGEIVALIGANGAGKTTMLRTISGFLRPATGTISYGAQPDESQIDITAVPAEQIVAAGISQCPEGRGIFAQLSVKENLLIGAYLRTDNQIDGDIKKMYDLFPILGERASQAAGSLSGGEQMMLALGRALMSRPKLLILDEPSLGLAPLIIEAIFELLEKINRQGMTILLVEQNAVMALDMSHRAYVLETGRVVLHGESKKLATNPRVQKAYLGGR